MTEQDVDACVEILNATIVRGGTTAHEDPMSAAEFQAYYFKDADVANVALSDGRIVGFQCAFEAEPGQYSIGSFTDRDHPVKGAGRALFDKTQQDCRALGGHEIIAKITADNVSGLGYYTAMGFANDTIVPRDHQRRTGQWVDRVIKHFPLTD